MANVRRKKAKRRARINSTLSARKLKKKHRVKLHISEYVEMLSVVKCVNIGEYVSAILLALFVTPFLGIIIVS